METKNLRLLPRRIITNSLDIDWYNNNQIWTKYEMKNGENHGDSKIWFVDGSLRLHNIWEDGKFVKRMV